MNIELYKINDDYFYFDPSTNTEGQMYVEEHDHFGERYIEVVSYDVFNPITEKVDAYINKYPELLNNIKEL